jgi:hypothetical protein
VQEADIWKLAGDYLNPDQIRELHDVADKWLADNPNQRFVAGARLAEVLALQPKSHDKPVGGLTSNIVGLLRLDPFQGLDPAVQQVEQSRVLAERAFFYFQHMPMLLSWQTDLLYSQLLANPQTQKLLSDTSTVAGSTTRFTDSTDRFADASSRLADTVEQFRRDLPQEQDQLMKQMNELVATQRDGAVRQATTQISELRDATVAQLGSTMTGQQKDLSAHTQALMDQSIDRLYARLRSLVIFTALMLLAALVVYRIIVAVFFSSRARR